jgi:hypothetical protein
MKTAREIENRIRQLLVDEVDRRVAVAQARIPVNCKFNHRQPLDPRKLVGGEPNPQYNRISDTEQTIGLCMVGAEDPEDWKGTICEDALDAQRCPLFQSVLSKEAVWKQLKLDLVMEGWAKERMPELYALLWVLDHALSPFIPWWKRVWFWFLRVEPEPRLTFIPDSLLQLPSSGSDETAGS